MIKAELSCPSEKVFIYNNLLCDVPTLPGSQGTNGHRTSNLEVDVLGIFDEQALVLLPEILARPEQTALVDMK